MKKAIKVGIIVFITIIGFTMTAFGQDTITISGVMKVPAFPEVTFLSISFHNEDWSYAENVYFDKESESTPYSITVPKFSSRTTVYVSVFNRAKEEAPVLYRYNAGTIVLYNRNVVKNIDISKVRYIPISGQVNITADSSIPKINYLVVAVWDKNNFNQSGQLGDFIFKNIDTKTGSFPFSIYVPAGTKALNVIFNIAYFINGELWDPEHRKEVWVEHYANGNLLPPFSNAAVTTYRLPLDLTK